MHEQTPHSIKLHNDSVIVQFYRMGAVSHNQISLYALFYTFQYDRSDWADLTIVESISVA